MNCVLFITLFITTINFAVEAEISSQWRPPYQILDESADEARDAEILRAVITSMKEWSERRNRTRIKRSQNNRACYGQLGCFEDSGPFGYLEMLPSPPQEINTRFLLYSTISRGDIPLLDVPFTNMSSAWRWADKAFNTSSPTKVIVHGFGSSCDHVWVYEMRSALMAVEECNVICVDWEAGALVPNYVRAAANTRLVGKQLAMLLEGLSDHINLDFEKVHLIGFSLGAHVAGFAGSQLKNISRITGLDPAGPLFEAQDPRARLDSTDAMFVDVIHSNGENLILGGLGSWQPMGHVDFYPNGGRMQTGCSNLFVGAVTDIIWSTANEGRSLCNHRRAYKFFTDSVSPKCHFPSFPCETYEDFLAGHCFGCKGNRCGNMGYYADKASGRGQLYLLTREEEPFCAHQYYVRVESSKSNQSVVSYGKILLTLVGDSGLNETFPLTRKDDAELTRGGVLYRMLVPHPALGIPIKVQLHYQAYSGWISSGLSRWTIDKVLLSDSFGKTSSVCKKGFVLNSGTPQTLPLYPGNCNPPKANDEQNINDASSSEDKNGFNIEEYISVQPSFIPTKVVQIGDEFIDKEKRKDQLSAKPSNIVSKKIDSGSNAAKDKLREIMKMIDSRSKPTAKSDLIEDARPSVIQMGKHFKIDLENKPSDPLISILDAADILNLPWQPLLANSLDNTQNERESGRAFGSINKRFRSFTFMESKNNEHHEGISEIVEPILKAPATKNARSHDTNKTHKEITEPILGSTVKPVGVTPTSSDSVIRTNRAHKQSENIKSEKNSENKTTTARDDKINWIPTHLSPSAYDKSDIWDYSNKTAKDDGPEKQNSVNQTADEDNTFSIFQWQTRKGKEYSDKKNESSFTVQFLPSRLVSFLEKAESYARNTLLPLVSAYTPRFLFFGKDSKENENIEQPKPKYVPLENISDIDIPEMKQSMEEKIELTQNIGPPDDTESNTIINRNTQIINKQTTALIPTEETTNDNLDEKYNLDYDSPGDPIKIVKAPDMSTTTLPPITIDSQKKSEKVIIVYPSNARDDRKIQSHSFPEIMQFESLYQSTSTNKNSIARSSNDDLETAASGDLEKTPAIKIDLPTYKPPLSSSSPYAYKRMYSTTPKFIPVSYPMEEKQR